MTFARSALQFDCANLVSLTGFMNGVRPVAIERALVSVYEKTGIVEFARALAQAGVEVVSTGGTAKLLRESGVKVREVSELTGWPEMLGGRVKTLHPKVHGGILFRRNRPDDGDETRKQGIAAIDLVVVNLYPFEATAARADISAEDLIENIDIGGPAMVRSAAKNFESVAVVTDPTDYASLLAEFGERRDWSLKTRLSLARKAFAMTACYDSLIATELERLQASEGSVILAPRPEFPAQLHLELSRHASLRYGENPHQKSAVYIPSGAPASGLDGARQLQGKELSYNNLVDLDAAWSVVQEFAEPACAIVKHNNPCGTAEQSALAEAYRQALACDPVSAFGGVMAFNRMMDRETAEEVAKLFVECIVAPGYDPAARETLAAKKNLRLMQMGSLEAKTALPWDLKRISGGVLVQDPDTRTLSESEVKVVTKRQPSQEELRDLFFGWKVAKHVKSNAIVFVRGGRTLGIGAGQMSRVDSVKIAVMKAQQSLSGSAVASDAFFPFPDGVEEAARAGAATVIQPGGSVRDADVIAAADRLGLSMVFTGVRHFRH
jgi:phosphoribosylaminoimidazolecarboxamide formyltransferase / IMP cyclohydrolase